MWRKAVSRRFVLIGAAAACLVRSRVNAASSPKIATGFDPADVRTQLLMLESEETSTSLVPGNRKALPPFSSENVYIQSLPRLVDLVDRSITRKSSLAGRGAILLGQINAEESMSPGSASPNAGLSIAPSFDELQSEYLTNFEKMRVREEFKGQVGWYVDKLIKNKPRYETASSQTRVPWYVIGVTHALEASFNFLAHLHNGDVPLDHQTVRVPAGKPNPWTPPFTWERSAEDALREEHFSGQIDWTLPRTLYRLESYNGFGYRLRNISSPYLWAFSDRYLAGKYVKDGAWSASAKSQQCGAAVMIHELASRGAIQV